MLTLDEHLQTTIVQVQRERRNLEAVYVAIEIDPRIDFIGLEQRLHSEIDRQNAEYWSNVYYNGANP